MFCKSEYSVWTKLIILRFQYPCQYKVWYGLHGSLLHKSFAIPKLNSNLKLEAMIQEQLAIHVWLTFYILIFTLFLFCTIRELGDPINKSPETKESQLEMKMTTVLRASYGFHRGGGARLASTPRLGRASTVFPCQHQIMHREKPKASPVQLLFSEPDPTADNEPISVL